MEQVTESYIRKSFIGKKGLLYKSQYLNEYWESSRTILLQPSVTCSIRDVQ